MLDKQSRNLGTDATIGRTMVVHIKSMAHVYSNTFFEHFSQEGHNSLLEDVSITLIDNINPSNPLQEKQGYTEIFVSDYLMKCVFHDSFIV